MTSFEAFFTSSASFASRAFLISSRLSSFSVVEQLYLLQILIRRLDQLRRFVRLIRRSRISNSPVRELRHETTPNKATKIRTIAVNRIL